ncbi:fructosamine kinase family protein [Sciscionella sediminilitoris]|uniref:fructosamine kinase family protein n=1 Tax=Sciscionella sediminilitoris TaxID=1445613 RepID=UPI0004DF7A66|nr:fructosamine kinase family protein [Sciscionella sp. SE31]
MDQDGVNIQALLGERYANGRGAGELRLPDGRLAVAKRAHARGASLVEAAGLDWLRSSGTVRVPEVYAADEQWLLTERIAEGSAGAPAEFGAALAGLHASGAPAFGAVASAQELGGWIGTAPLPLAESDSWPRWYAEHRVLYYLRLAVDQGSIDAEGARLIERVAERLPELGGPPEPPARLHGDLWNGNVLWDGAGQAWLIDPSAHGGHREADLAMLALFGCPRLPEILDGYTDRWPLADGWRERIPLHQLFPLLVHTVLFGGGYAGSARRAALAALRIG